MKNQQIGKLICFTAALSTLTIQAATFNVSNVAQLKNAINQARNNGPSKDLIRFNGGGKWFSDEGRIIVNTPCIIDGISPSTTTIFNLNNVNEVFNISSNNVEIKNFHIFSGVTTRGFTGGIQIANQYWGISILNNVFDNHAYGVTSARGAIPKNLTINGNTFNRNRIAGVAFNRDAGNFSNPNWGGKYVINNNTFNSCHVGITLDNGNDGSETINGVLVGIGEMNKTGDKVKSPKLTAYMEGSIISGNKIYDYDQFGIALAKVQNIDVKNNQVSTGKSVKWGGGIHLEHRTRDCVVQGNSLTLNGTQNGDQAGINVVTAFYKRSSTFGCTNITVVDNTFFGRGWGVRAYGFNNLNIYRNGFWNVAAKWKSFIEGPANTFGQNWGNRGLPNGRALKAGSIGQL